MPARYTLRDAKARLSELLDKATRGEEVEIVRRGAKGGRFRLLAIDGGETLRKPGALKGRIAIGEEFDAEVPSLTAAFEGRG